MASNQPVPARFLVPRGQTMTRRKSTDPNLRSSAASLFGALLRRSREAKGMSQGELARLIPCSRPLVTRIEAGIRVPQKPYVTACDTLLGTGGELLEIWEEVDWYAQVEHPDWFKRFAKIESTATMIQEYQVLRISGLLQTETYMRALFAGGQSADDPDRIEEMVTARLGRQDRLFGPNPPLLTVILAEPSLRQLVGGPEVMHEQLGHLLKVGRLSNIVLQVAPFSLGAHSFGCTMTLLTLPEGRPRLYTESLSHGHFIEDPDQIQLRQRRYARLQADALSVRESAELIQSLREGLLNMRTTAGHLPTESWRKSSYSDDDGGQCIEVAHDVPGHVPVRDSKDPEGPALVFSTYAWRSFIAGIRAGDFPAGC
ncbi:Scr1 family TA system antitoxin-like transcriptional regulator [Kitasatospora sp. NPDC050543]|uniref:Scr1 family TA system antitoxin-like transcriptional regulator n=1 Tax=Kitasatospora sp. NPDC050543 TaxID=3364054 RepID=UPI00379FBA78